MLQYDDLLQLLKYSSLKAFVNVIQKIIMRPCQCPPKICQYWRRYSKLTHFRWTFRKLEDQNQNENPLK